VALLQLTQGVSAPRIAGMIPLARQAIRRSDIVVDPAVWSGPCTRSRDPEQHLCWKVSRDKCLAGGAYRISKTLRRRIPRLESPSQCRLYYHQVAI
jgi:hypothetical protein